jgi:hypothetical protein
MILSFKAKQFLLFVAIAGMCTLFVPTAHAQVSVQVGPAPVCPYGYYEAPPYNCAPYGYYGPEWFVNGIFIGAGPWYHGPEHFYGHVNNHFHPEHGYRGPMPQRGEHATRPLNHIQNFKGNEMRDGRGHVRGHGK